MRLRKIFNRVYRGTTYYRWTVEIPPKRIRELGWVEGQELEVVVTGGALQLRPIRRHRTAPEGREIVGLEARMRRKSIDRHWIRY
jgi:antitoxin component of MazEF toxin-antitoxin module